MVDSLLSQAGGALSSADAEGYERTIGATAVEFFEGGEHEAGAGGADRVAERDRSAIRVEPAAVDLAGSIERSTAMLPAQRRPR